MRNMPAKKSAPAKSSKRAIAPKIVPVVAPVAAPVIGIVMGSANDWAVMSEAATVLEAFAVPYEARVVSAHRTPDLLHRYGSEAQARGLQVIIAGAGGAAHLPGMLAALTTIPVLGVPMPSKALNGVDSLLSIVQMPKGVPVLTLAIGAAGAANAALSAVAILALNNAALRKRLQAYRAQQTAQVLADSTLTLAPDQAR
jgi:5-(carboxyamino)imidazole ribonucleotide mutase